MSKGKLPNFSIGSNLGPSSSSPSNRSDHSGEDSTRSPDSPPPTKKRIGGASSVSEPFVYVRAGSEGLTRSRKKPSQNISYQLETLKGLITRRGISVVAGQPELETANFQELISHLVCGSPLATHSLPGEDELRKNRVVVAWMAMVSEEFFFASDTHFPQLKSLGSSKKFKIKHPGSDRFVEPGLKSFFDSGLSTKLQPQENTFKPRAFYLLSKQQLKDHEFPVPGSTVVTDLSDYVKVTAWPEEEPQLALENGDALMYAIDCEMVETRNGSELARVSIVNESLICIYNSLVKPENPVIDYRTQYSGIDEGKLKHVTVKLSNVQRKIIELLPPSSILVGHSLDCDLKALKLTHPYVIDTSCIFTPNATPRCKPKLKKLAKELLRLEIQGGSGGHDSEEDARTCMQLVQHKIRSGSSCTISFNEPNIITDFKAHGKITGFVDRGGAVKFFDRSSSYSCHVDSDDDCIEKALQIIPECDFTFLQLHDMEMFFKDNKTHPTEQAVARKLDDSIIRLVEGCPEGTLLFVVCGSGDIREVIRLRRDKFANSALLNKAVLCAKTGLVVAFITS